MLFPYKYVAHQMEKMQEFIDFIFHGVWCKAPDSGSFDIELFNENADFKALMNDLYFSGAKSAESFCQQVQCIYGCFAGLSPVQIDQLKQWYQANNDIAQACANDPSLQLVRYADITPINTALCIELAAFFKGLYSQELLGIAALREQIGEIDDHYKCFMQENRVGKCPFCGINDIKGIHHTRREAYDHYLPKGLYPFNSINFRNLAPTCHECNSSYKLTKDPLNSSTGRRRAFYPYANIGYSIQVKVDIRKADVTTLEPGDIQLEFGPAALKEEIETWKDVYEIEERYKAKCCSETDGKYWLTQAIDEWPQDGRSPADYMKSLARHTQNHPFADSNFLKKAFLEGCQSIGVFEA